MGSAANLWRKSLNHRDEISPLPIEPRRHRGTEPGRNPDDSPQCLSELCGSKHS
jgi:hypothetical protein